MVSSASRRRQYGIILLFAAGLFFSSLLFAGGGTDVMCSNFIPLCNNFNDITQSRFDDSSDVRKSGTIGRKK